MDLRGRVAELTAVWGQALACRCKNVLAHVSPRGVMIEVRLSKPDLTRRLMPTCQDLTGWAAAPLGTVTLHTRICPDFFFFLVGGWKEWKELWLLLISPLNCEELLHTSSARMWGTITETRLTVMWRHNNGFPQFHRFVTVSLLMRLKQGIGFPC